MSSYSYADRFSWAVGRQTKEPEDRIYSLLGLLGVTLPAIDYSIGLKSALQQLKSAISREREDRISHYMMMSFLYHLLRI
jgi:hypothetical protein